MDLSILTESLPTTLPWWPCFDLVHCILCCLAIRDEIGPDALEFSKKHPLSTYLSSMLCVFAGALICNPLLGEPVLGALKSQGYVVMATLVWYLTFYCPSDLHVTMCKVYPVKVTLYVIKEIYRVHKVTAGVSLAAKVFPGNYLIMIIIGTIKGNASAFMMIISSLFRGKWEASSMEVISPTFQTKGCLIASVIFILEKNTNLIIVPYTLVCIGVGSFFVYSKLVYLFDIHAPFIPLESASCYYFCGGITDLLSAIIANISAMCANISAMTASNESESTEGETNEEETNEEETKEDEAKKDD
ncbi:unnamed protein product [Meganyctiphanes norvegica]|uniref:Uncharacterized protein n=1 Tax=Meganyctiphanes norvegica TaxID=48144 RepID=A0AAV2RN22_MEGNR